MVPELTRSADIKLNPRLSLRTHRTPLRLFSRAVATDPKSIGLVPYCAAGVVEFAAFGDPTTVRAPTLPLFP
jgi:hypothetical protein